MLKLKNSYIKKLLNEREKNGRSDERKIKNIGAIDFSDVIGYVKQGLSEDDFNSLCEDISSGEIKIGIDADTVRTLIANKDDKNIQRLFQTAKMPKMDIDIECIGQLSAKDLQSLDKIGVNIGKIHLNSGWEKGAVKGHSLNAYRKIASTAEAMVSEAKSNLEKKNKGKSFESLSDKDKFMTLYNMVIAKASYDKSDAALKDKTSSKYFEARSVESFFCKNGSGVCSGFANALYQLGTMCGLEMEYVQGNSKSANMDHSEYHAWVRVKIGGKWYNADPTWDANQVKGKYGYCLKSDADFDGHVIDNEYAPTFKRTADDRLIASEGYRVYEGAYESYNNSALVRDYYTSELDGHRAGYSNLTAAEAARLRMEKDPTGAATGLVKGSGLLVILFNLLIKLTSFPKNVVDKVKSKLHSGKLDMNRLNSSDAEDYIREEAEKESAFEGIQVDPKQAVSYRGKSSDEKATKEQETEKDR